MMSIDLCQVHGVSADELARRPDMVNELLGRISGIDDGFTGSMRKGKVAPVPGSSSDLQFTRMEMGMHFATS